MTAGAGGWGRAVGRVLDNGVERRRAGAAYRELGRGVRRNNTRVDIGWITVAVGQPDKEMERGRVDGRLKGERRVRRDGL